jgi:hypothetical protein
MGGILGGGDSGDQEVTTKVSYPDWWMKMFRPAMESLQPIYQAQAQQPIHPLAQMAYQGIAQQAVNGSPMRQQGMDYISQLLGGPAPARTPPPGTADPSGNPLAGIDWSGAPPSPPPPPPAAQPPPPPGAPPAARQEQLIEDMNKLVQLYDPRTGRNIWVSNH